MTWLATPRCIQNSSFRKFADSAGRGIGSMNVKSPCARKALHMDAQEIHSPGNALGIRTEFIVDRRPRPCPSRNPATRQVAKGNLVAAGNADEDAGYALPGSMESDA